MDVIDELIACCEAWEPEVCVMGNVRAGDAANRLRFLRGIALPLLTGNPSVVDYLDVWHRSIQRVNNANGTIAGVLRGAARKLNLQARIESNHDRNRRCIASHAVCHMPVTGR